MPVLRSADPERGEVIDIDGRGAQVLVAEHDDRIAELLCKALVRHGFDPHLVDDVESAVRTAGLGCFRALVLHLDRPDGSLAVLGRLRAAGSMLPVLVIDGREGPRDRAAATRAGAREYLPMPFRIADLVTAVHRLLACDTERPASCGPAPVHRAAG